MELEQKVVEEKGQKMDHKAQGEKGKNYSEILMYLNMNGKKSRKVYKRDGSKRRA